MTQFLPGTAGAMAGAVTAVIAETVGVAAPLDIGPPVWFGSGDTAYATIATKPAAIASPIYAGAVRLVAEA